MLISKIISLILIIIGLLILIIIKFFSRKNNNIPKKRKDNHNFCILVPARYESKVIGDLLESIKNQSYKINMKDVYVIVETKNDETVNICKKYDATVIVRKNLELQRKGYALDEAVKYILSNKKYYDAYFIFDADNVLDKDYIKNMIPIFDEGYDMASGYRNCKNGNKGVVAASSQLTFCLVNSIFNNRKNKLTKNITFSGTGFYIRGYLIEKWKGYPFNTLTEDYEISLYGALNDLTTFYNTKSVFYDEQPIKFKNTINQRIRWIRGYFDVRKLYRKKLFKSLNKNNPNNGSKLDETVGIIPFIFIVLGLVILFLSLFFNSIYYLIFNKSLVMINWLIIFLLLVYILLMFITIIILIIEKNNIAINKKMKIKTIFYNPIFMITYVFCAIKALTTKNVTWKKVEHGN